MKKQIEQLLIFLLPAILLEKVSQTYINNLVGELVSGNPKSLGSLMENFPSYSVGEFITFVNTANVLIGLLPAVIIAVWIWKIEKAEKGRPFLWAIGSLFLNYWILMLFIGQRIYEKKTT